MRPLLLSLLLLIPGSDDFAAGMKAYAEGRYKEALAAFAAAELAAGNEASPELLYNRALCALRMRRMVEAEYSAEKAAARGGPDFAALCNFLRGNAEYLRCQTAEAEALLVEADPTAYDRALGHARSSLEHWTLAASSRSDWPEARRNAERALLKLEQLVAKREEALANQKKKQATPPQPELEPPEDPTDPEESEEQAPELQLEADPLSLAEVADMLQRLAAKEKEKRDLRRARRQTGAFKVKKDW
ncbi:MAG: hypothetical protein ACYTG5_01965 [Planctomycetota bacterium]|jgi:hypothetical protein